eukprot:366344-Chlamydomonas_euryale.AAC.8
MRSAVPSGAWQQRTAGVAMRALHACALCMPCHVGPTCWSLALKAQATHPASQPCIFMYWCFMLAAWDDGATYGCGVPRLHAKLIGVQT